jgi:hypothetical protein
MDKIWFMAINGKQEGPYSIEDLKRDSRLTPDTLVWRQGFKKWLPIRFVPELKEIFKDKSEGKPLHEEKKLKPFTIDSEPATLTLQNDPFQFFLWLLVISLLLFYFFYLYSF